MTAEQLQAEYGDVPLLTVRVRDLVPLLGERTLGADPVWLIGRLRDEMTAYLPEILEGLRATLGELLQEEEQAATCR